MKKQTILLVLTAATMLFSCGNSQLSVQSSDSSLADVSSSISQGGTSSSATSSNSPSSSTAPSSTVSSSVASSSSSSSSYSSSSSLEDNKAQKLLSEKFGEDFSFIKSASLTEGKVIAKVTDANKYLALLKMGNLKVGILDNGELFYTEYGTDTLTVSFYNKQDISSFLPTPDNPVESAKIQGYKISEDLFYLTNRNDLYNYYFDSYYSNYSVLIYKDTMFTLSDESDHQSLMTVSKKKVFKSETGLKYFPSLGGFKTNHGYMIPMSEEEFMAYIDEFSLTISSASMQVQNMLSYEVFGTGFDYIYYTNGILSISLEEESSSGKEKINPKSLFMVDEDYDFESAFGYEKKTFDTSEARDSYLTSGFTKLGTTDWYLSKDEKSLGMISSSSSSNSKIKRKSNPDYSVHLVPNLSKQEGYAALLSYIGMTPTDNCYLVYLDIDGSEDKVDDHYLTIKTELIYSSLPTVTVNHYGYVESDEEESGKFISNLSASSTYTYKPFYILYKDSLTSIQDNFYMALGEKDYIPSDTVVFQRETVDGFEYLGTSQEISKLATAMSLEEGVEKTSTYGSALYKDGKITLSQDSGSTLYHFIKNIETILGTKTNLTLANCDFSTYQFVIKDTDVFNNFLTLIKSKMTALDDKDLTFYNDNGVISIQERINGHKISYLNNSFKYWPTKISDVYIYGMMGSGSEYSGFFYNTTGMAALIESSLVSYGYVKTSDTTYKKGVTLITLTTSSDNQKINVVANFDNWWGKQGVNNACFSNFLEVTGKALYVPSAWEFSTVIDNAVTKDFTLTVPTAKADTMATRFETILGASFVEGTLTTSTCTIVRTANSFAFTKTSA